MKTTDKSSGRGCARSIVAWDLANKLVKDGILNQPIAILHRKQEEDVLFRFDNKGYYYRASTKWISDWSAEEPLWFPSFVDAEAWAKAAKAFLPRRDLKFNVEHFLLPEMEEYVLGISDDEIILLLRECLLGFGVVNIPIRQIAGDTYYFNKEEVYSLDKGSRLFAYETQTKHHTFKVADYLSFNMNVWNKAVKQFEVGMTLNDCMKILLDTELEFNQIAGLPFIDRLVQRIENPEFEREPENDNEATFDRIRVQVGLPRYMFQSWEELKSAVLENRSEIDRRVLQKIAADRQFKWFNVPINFIKLSAVLLRRNYALEYIFELKG